MIDKRIAQLRRLMTENKIEAYVIPGSDEHQNEYLPEMWKRREWISGFTGSAGSVVVTLDKAGLWTDSRYYLQAEEQLKESPVNLFRVGTPGTPDMWEWLRYELSPGMHVGIDPRLIPVQTVKHAHKLFLSREIRIKYIEENLVDIIWDNRPEFPAAPAVPHPLQYSGEDASGKLVRVREELKKENCSCLVLSRLDSIAWLFNIRGNDIPYNPLVIAYAVVTESEAALFIEPEKVTEELKSHLAGTAVLYDYSNFKTYLMEYQRQQNLSGQKKIWLDESSTSAWIAGFFEAKSIYYGDCPVYFFKAIKNSTEIANFKKAHLRDGVAMVRFLKWLDENVQNGSVTEAGAARKLEEFRAANDLYRELSFPTISAYNEHAAIVHYSHTDASNSVLKKEGIYLVDSGAHYLDGTTDITRTIALGVPTEEQKERFTRVLQGHINLALANFPGDTLGIQLDTLARIPLWEIGLDYGHGTGHGIGSYLNVHEGPHSISQSRGVMVKLKEGMFCSNEPGYYKTGEYGIRIENIVYVAGREAQSNTENGFLHFKTITLCPIDLKLVKKAMLTEKQLSYLNNYHMLVRAKLNVFLDEEERKWLAEATALI